MTNPTPSPASAPLVELGAGRPVLVLHGGGGPRSVAGFVETMAAGAHVLAPTHPGFAGAPWLQASNGISDAARHHAELLERRGLEDVLVVGFSMGGWIAAELALRASGRLRGLVLVDAVGIEVPGEEIADVFALTPQGLADLSLHDPARHFVDPASLPDAQREAIAANFRALDVYGRERRMRDPGLRARLAHLAVPTLVVWGESDRIATPTYGRALADAIPGARFERIAECGHMPQVEQPARLLELVRGFAA